MKKDTKIPNAATFEIQREDHTIGNMVRMKLLEDKSVLFAGYRMPHPLNPLIEVKVQTRPDTSPLNAFDKALVSLIQDASSINDDFQVRMIIVLESLN
jgi:DNA-directed RNA polymerase II subunit RPB11